MLRSILLSLFLLLPLGANQDFIKLWVGYCAANGVTATPAVEKGDGLQVEGYVPPTYIIWHTATGQVVQAVSILQMTDNPQDFLRHVQFAYGIPLGEKVTWKDYRNPPPPVAGKPDPVVGKLFRDDLYDVNAGGVQEGAEYNAPDGARYVAVRFGFTTKWRKR